MRLLIVALLSAACAATAADIALSDGRVLRDARIVSQSAGRVCIRHTEGITQVEKALLTGDLATRYPADHAAIAREDDKLADEAKRQADRVEAKARAMEQRQSARPSMRDDTPASQDAKEIKAVARAYAERYFRRNQDGSTNSWSFSMDAFVEEPETMAGWLNQWRVSGEVSTRDLSSTGGLSSVSHRFEAIVTLKNGVYSVIDFTVR